MTHRFDPKHRDVLDDPGRKEWQDPDVLINWLSLIGDETIVDLGAGTGYFAIPLASVSPKINVFAIDVSEEMLDVLKDKVKAAKLKNVYPILSNESGMPVDEYIADIVLVADVFHEIADDPAMLGGMERILKDDGRLVVIDWKKKFTHFGPPYFSRKTPEQVAAILRRHDFELNDEADLYPNHYTLEFVKHQK